MHLYQSTVKLATIAEEKHNHNMVTNDAYRLGWRDASMGEDFIQDNMPFDYYEAVAIFMNSAFFEGQ